jgi:hypothetical protein
MQRRGIWVSCFYSPSVQLFYDGNNSAAKIPMVEMRSQCVPKAWEIGHTSKRNAAVQAEEA